MSGLKKYTLNGPRAWFLWILANLYVISVFSIQTCYSVINPHLQTDLGFALGQLGILAATYTWVFAVVQLFGGALLDRFGIKWVLIVANFCVVLSTLLIFTSHSFTQFIFGQILLAFGASVGFVSAGYVSGHWFGQEKFARMFGLVQVLVATVSAFITVIISHLLGFLDWRQIYIIFFIFSIILLVCNFLWMKDPKPIVGTKENFMVNIFKSFAICLKKWDMWSSMLWGGLTFGLQFALGVYWGPKILIAHGISTHWAYYASFAVWLGLAAGCYVFPVMSEHLRRRKLPSILGTFIQLVIICILVYMPVTSVEGIILLFLFGVGNSAHMLAFASAEDVVGLEHVGASAALVNSSMFVIGGLMMSIPSLILGNQVLNEHNLVFIFSPLVVLIAIACILTLFMKETYPKS